MAEWLRILFDFRINIVYSLSVNRLIHNGFNILCGNILKKYRDYYRNPKNVGELVLIVTELAKLAV